MDFTHLHVHSHYSLLDGLPKIKDLVKSAKQKGYKALALTDHGNISGAIEFYKTCKEFGIKPILGCEAYLAPVSMADRDPKNKYHHLLLLAETQEGYINLLKLVTKSYLEGFYYKPRMDKELLKKYHKGIIASSACFSGEISKILRSSDNLEKAKTVALEYQEIFGKNNFYLEIMDLPALEGQMEVNNKLIQLSNETGIPLIVTKDVHYVNEEDAEAQDIITCIRDGRQVNDPTRNSIVDIETYLDKPDNIIQRFKHVPEAITNTNKIAERCNLSFEFGKNLIPAFPTPNDPDSYLTELCFAGLKKKYNLESSVENLIKGNNISEAEQKLKERLDYELAIIIKMGFTGYFLIVWDFVKWAKDSGIVVGPGRGSAAGAIVAYTLDITTIDPLAYGLLFERFLNPDRISMPDIDMDFADESRDRVIEYVADKYGRDCVAQICTFGTMAARAAVKDVGRAYGLSFAKMNEFAKLIPDKPGTKLQDAINGSPEMKEIIKNNEVFKQVVDNALKLEGMNRHMSVHACAVVIADDPLTNYTALQHPPKDDTSIITQFSAKPLEDLGLLKMDFLGLRNLTVLQHTLEVIEKTTNKKIELRDLPIDDQKTFELLCNGETTSVFQLESSGMRKYLKDLKPSEFEDIIAMVALYRPGPLNSGMVEEFIDRKHGVKEISYLHPIMESSLKNTYGVIVYQEQVMQLSKDMAGFTGGQADTLRKAMGKKIAELMKKMKVEFLAGCRQNDIPNNIAKETFESMETFAEYGFNKSHAACYAMIAYQTAYLKANYPIQYMTAVLISESGDTDKMASIIAECNRMGIKVLPPSVNESFVNFAMIKSEDNKSEHIRIGLSSVKNVGGHIAEVIYRERKNNGKYKNLEDLIHRCRDKDLNKKSLESLIKCGGLDCFEIDRGELLGNSENILNYIKHLNELENAQQDSLFSGTSIEMDKKIRMEKHDQATEDDKLYWEKELLGLYVTSHPFIYYENIMKGCFTPLEEVSTKKRDDWVVVGGVINKTKKKITKRGKMMMFVTIQDTSSSMELLVFPKTYEITKDVWVEGRIVRVSAKTPKEAGDDKLFVESANELTKETALQWAQQSGRDNNQSSEVNDISDDNNQEDYFVIKLNKQDVKEKGEKIKEILGKYPGEKQVYLDVEGTKIKTSFTVDDSSDLDNELGSLGVE